MLRHLRQMTPRSPWAAGGLALLAVLMGGACASASYAEAPATSEPTAIWGEPAWMDEYRRDMLVWQEELSVCYAEHGVATTPAPSGGVDLQPIYLAVDPPETGDMIVDAMWICFERVGMFGWWDLPLDDAAYGRLLDSRDCVIAQGFTVPEPPSFEDWLEEHAMWFPHEYASDSLLLEGHEWTHQEWEELNRLCPQPGPNTFSVTGLPQGESDGD